MSFLYKFTLLLGSLVIMSSFIQFFIFDRFFLANTDDLLLTINEKAANNFAEQILAYFKNIEASLKTIASDPNINQAILDKINQIVPEVNVISILDKNGDVMLVSGVKDVSGLNLSQRDYFQRAIRGETYISGVYTSNHGRKVVSIATPIIENGNIVGVVVGTVWLHENSLSSMFDNKSFGRGGFISITDSQGIIVYHPDKESIGKGTSIADHLQGGKGSAIIKYTGLEHYIGYSKVPELNWIVSVNTPTAEVTRIRRLMIYEILAISIFTIFVVIAIGTYTVRRYTKPLDTLVEAFSSVKKGKYKQIISYDYAPEFDDMIQVYNNTIRRLEEVHTTLKWAADIDGLTGTYNRRSFDKILELLNGEVLAHSLDNLGIMILDLDNYKQLNDTYGHLAGDDILREFTAITQSIVGIRFVFRFGGDEFAIILRNVAREKIISLAEKIRLQSEKTLKGCTVSIGIATYPENADSVDALLDFADKALYISKETKNRVTAYVISN
ncbi:sensor domain-containing diguanylate cyclase [Pelorhabdus rhamnosifermentans]|uniref:sensor domain-containing diguanylate cyclase n=1 Tax=Pelorhabdus rhamnosifermentans TaxID=2772457 RepID=UPI001C060B42|nr:sensor domain-containing diguanylate cyclase [Pelorhabdus rhamnosifermentans]